MTRYKNFILLALTFLTTTSFKLGKDYDPYFVHITGYILDYRTDLPLKKYPVYIGNSPVKYYTFYDDDFNIISKGESNKQGEFVLDVWINKNDPTFWLITSDYAQVKFENLDTANLKYGGTINVGQISLVPYDRELKEERYNIPKTNPKRENKKLDKYTLTEIKYLFPIDSVVKRMSFNSVDTTTGFITRLNFGPDNPRGTIIQSFKTLTFKVDLSK